MRLLPMFVLLFASALAAPGTVRAEAPPALAEIVLVRHGHYDADPKADARLGPGLSPIGVAQARLAGARLRGEAPFDTVLVSPMQRARDTAASIGLEMPDARFAVVEDLRECTPPTRRTEVTAEETPEALASCKAQLDRIFARYFKPADGSDRRRLLVCHGNVIRYLVTRALGVDSAAWLEMSVGHASLTRIRVEADGRYKVIAVGDVGHLAPTLRTGASGDVARSLAIPALPER